MRQRSTDDCLLSEGDGLPPRRDKRTAAARTACGPRLQDLGVPGVPGCLPPVAVALSPLRVPCDAVSPTSLSSVIPLVGPSACRIFPCVIRKALSCSHRQKVNESRAAAQKRDSQFQIGNVCGAQSPARTASRWPGLSVQSRSSPATVIEQFRSS